MPTKQPNWAKQAKLAMETAKQMMLQDGQMMTFFTLHCPGRSIVIATPFYNDRFKAACLELVRLMIIAERANGLTSVSEAWMRKVQPRHGESEAEALERIDAVRPGGAEDQIETLIVHTTYRDKAGRRQAWSRCCEIERDATGKPSGFAELQTETMTGRFAELLPEETPSDREVEQARALLPLARAVLGVTMQKPPN